MYRVITDATLSLQKEFDLAGSLIINYHVSAAKKWMVLIGQGRDPAGSVMSVNPSSESVDARMPHIGSRSLIITLARRRLHVEEHHSTRDVVPLGRAQRQPAE